MREERLAKIASDMETATFEANNLITTLSSILGDDSKPFDLNAKIPNTDSSTTEIVGRVILSTELLQSMKSSKQASFLPYDPVDIIHRSVADFTSSAQSLRATIQSIEQTYGGLKSIDYGNFYFYSVNGQTQNLQPAFIELFSTSERILQNLLTIFPFFGTKSAPSFQTASRSLQELISSLASQIADSNSALKDISRSRSELEAIILSIRDEQLEINRILDEVGSSRKTITEYLTEVTRIRTEAASVSSESDALKKEVLNYRRSFDSFDKQLRLREDSLELGTKKIGEIVDKYDSQRSIIQDLINQSEQMLSSATVSGLASNYKDIMDKLTKEQRDARWFFYFSIFMLFISAIPLLGLILLPVIAPFLKLKFDLDIPDTLHSPSGDVYGTFYVGQVISRIIVLLPAAWLVSFSAIRHASLFRLREHYAYKYSMAVSVEGFKKQAPTYSEEIAAMVLEHLAFNPTDRLGSSRHLPEGKMPGIAGLVLNKIRERLTK